MATEESKAAAVMPTRRLGSLWAGLALLVVGTTGVLLLVTAYSDPVARLHTIAGLGFLAAVTLHITHNLRTWVGYLGSRRGPWPSLPLVIAVTLALGVAAIGWYPNRAAGALFLWNKSLQPPPPEMKAAQYQTIRLDLGGGGPLLTLDIKAGPYFEFVDPVYGFDITPQMAAWTEDEHQQFLETLYVTHDEGGADYPDGPNAASSARPAALPVWAHHLGMASSASSGDGRHAKAPDVVTSASPLNNTYLVTRAHGGEGGFFVFFEVNSSNDYNDYYRRDSFPDEPGYSNGGNPAQPSVVYRAWVDPRTTRFVLMEPVGHGHHAGANGDIDPDLSHLTTALHIVDRIVVEARPGG